MICHLAYIIGVKEMLDGIISFEEVINSIIKLNRKIKIIAVLKEKNIEIEEYLLKNRSI